MMIALWTLLFACSPTVDAPRWYFVRGGLLSEAAGRAPAFEAVAWTPGQALERGGVPLTAPQQAECRPIFSVPLGDVGDRIAAGGTAPDTAVAFSPDGRWLAVGDFGGVVHVVDGVTGRERIVRRLSEAVVKGVAWSVDGRTLYAAEQSPDALVHALDPETLADRWTVRLADRVGTSAVAPGDLYGVYTLPAALGLVPQADGSLLVVATHAWNTDEGRRNAAAVLNVDAAGQIVAAWPPEGALSATLVAATPSPKGDAVAVAVSRSADGEAPRGLPIGGVQVLRLPSLEPVGGVALEPLLPWYSRVYLWDTVAYAGDALWIGATDGRLARVDAASLALRELLPLGAPRELGGVPVVATLGHVRAAGDQLLALTSESSIPFGSADPALRPPSLHPNENTLFAFDTQGQPRWSWRGPYAPQGMTVLGDALVVGAGARTSDQRRDLYGALVFRLNGEGTGDERLQTVCHTEGPVFFRQAVAADGRVALVELPFTTEAGALGGAYRVTVFR